MVRTRLNSEFLQYLVSIPDGEGDSTRVPSLVDLSQQSGVSVARLREQLEVARVMGLVEVRPRTGIRRLKYSFYPAVQHSLAYALELDRANFEKFADLRNQLESAYWHQAVCLLTPQDHEELKLLLASAWSKLNGSQIEIPHTEHRQLHLLIYSRMDNPFVSGILEAYWEAYEAVGLNLYAGLEYLHEVWNYHQHMVDAICAGDFDAGYQALVEHTDLLYIRSEPAMIDDSATSK